MSRRRKIFVGVLGGLLACAVIGVPTRNREPTYNGKKLSEWVAMHSWREDAVNYEAEREQAGHAIRQIGTNAIPFLLAWSEYPKSAWRPKVYKIVRRMPQFIAKPIESVIDEEHATHKRIAAAGAFKALGVLGAPAIPELSGRITGTNNRGRRSTAILALSYLGPDAVPTFISALSDPKQTLDSRGYLLLCVESLGTNAGPLVPLLIQNLYHTNATIVRFAAQTLGKCRLEPGTVVPVLSELLQNPKYQVRNSAVNALSAFGELAKPAVPALVRTLNDPNEYVRESASNALQKIAPEALTNAPGR